MIRAVRAALSVSVALALVLSVALGVSPATAKGRAHPPMMLGPGDAGVHDIGGEAIIRMSRFGYVYIAGQQHTHLRIKFVKERNILRYRDTGTDRVKSMPKRCAKERVRKGISVICTIPKAFRSKKMFVQVWPRLGNDYVDARTLPRRFRLWVLTDAGRDVVHGGAGNDFVNGAKGNDLAWGGAGNDFLRQGPGADRMYGGPGRDRIGRG